MTDPTPTRTVAWRRAGRADHAASYTLTHAHQGGERTLCGALIGTPTCGGEPVEGRPVQCRRCNAALARAMSADWAELLFSIAGEAFLTDDAEPVPTAELAWLRQVPAATCAELLLARAESLATLHSVRDAAEGQLDLAQQVQAGVLGHGVLLEEHPAHQRLAYVIDWAADVLYGELAARVARGEVPG
jgi:hypothetical protein